MPLFWKKIPWKKTQAVVTAEYKDYVSLEFEETDKYGITKTVRGRIKKHHQLMLHKSFYVLLYYRRVNKRMQISMIASSNGSFENIHSKIHPVYEEVQIQARVHPKMEDE